MPRAHGAEVKYHYEHDDSDRVIESPPIQNTWYEVFDAEDVRLIWCQVNQTNDEAAAKDVEIKWTIDGVVYFTSWSLANGTWTAIYRYWQASLGGTAGLNRSTTIYNPGYRIDVRGKAFKIEIRMTSIPGTNQVLNCWCVKETLEQT